MYYGGTTLEEAANAIHAKATISMQQYCTEKTLPVIAAHGQETVALNHPIGVKGTDEFLMAISRISGKPVSAELTKERGRLVDAMADLAAHIHGKKFAIYGDPDLCLGLTAFLMELAPAGACSLHQWRQGLEQEDRTAARQFAVRQELPCIRRQGIRGTALLLFTEPVDFLIGNTYGKYLERDTGTPLIRIGFPIFDRHHYHRYPMWGYQGGMNVLVWILDKIFDEIDRNTNVVAKSDYSFDIIR